MLRDRLRDIPVGTVFEEVYARMPRERFPVLRGTCRCIVIAPTAEGGRE